MKTTAITRKKLRKIEVNVQVFAWQTEGSKNRDWPLVVIMQIEWQERTTSDSPKYSAKRSKAVCACDSRVSRGSLTAALAECESCLCNSCNSAYAWQWFVIHLRFESSLDFNAFLSISNAYLMPHATPHMKSNQRPNETNRKRQCPTRRMCNVCRCNRVERLFWVFRLCLYFRWHVCQLAISLLALLKSRSGLTSVFCRLLTLRHRRLVLQFYSSFFAKYYCCYCWRWRRFCRFGFPCLSLLLLPL